MDELFCIYDKGLATLSIGVDASLSATALSYFNGQEFLTHEPLRNYNSAGDPDALYNSGTATWTYPTPISCNSIPQIAATPKSKLISDFQITQASDTNNYRATIYVKHNDNSYFYYYIQFTPDAPTVTLNNSTYTTCMGATDATMTASGAQSYVWSNSLGSQATANIPTSATGSVQYTVTGTGSNGCTATATAYVTVNPLPTVTINGSANATVNGCASAILTAGGASDYSWSTVSTANSIQINTVGTYTVTLTGTSNNCSNTATATVTIYGNPTVTISGPPSACSDTVVALTASGASSYVWKKDGTTLSSTADTLHPNATGDYTVTGTDANGCSAVSSAHHFELKPTPTVTISGTTAICSGNSTTLIAESNPVGTTYLWSDNTTTDATFPVSTGGAYSVTGTLNGCSSSATVTVTEAPTPAAPTAPSVAPTHCGSGTLTLTASAASGTINWYETAASTNIIATGSTCDIVRQAITENTTITRYAAVQNAEGCLSARVPVTGTFYVLPAAPVTENITHCGPTTVTLTATGSNSLTWYSDAQGNTTLNATTQNVTTTTTFYVASTDGNNCRSALVPLTVTIHDVPAMPALETTTFCKEAGTGVQLNAGQGNYYWYTTVGGTQYNNPYTANNAGTYYVTSYNTNCESAPLAVTVLETPSVPSAEDVTLCAAGSATLSVNNPSSDYTYTWYSDADLSHQVGTGASVNVNVTADDTYYVTAANGNCVSTAKAVTVTIRQSIDAPAIATSIYACGGNATLPATFGSNTLTWKNSEGAPLSDFNVTLSSGSASYTATYVVNGCESQPANVTVTYEANPTISATGTSRCGSGEVTLTATTTGTAYWFDTQSAANAFTDASSTHTATGATYSPSVTATKTYYVRALSEHGCLSTVANAVATVNNNTDQLTTTNLDSCGSATVTLTATGSNSLTWYSDAQGETVLDATTQNVTTTTIFYVASTDGNNCRSALVPLTVTIHDVPAMPALETTTFCKAAGTGVQLNAGQGNYYWYTTIGGTQYGNPYTATNAGTYYVTSYNTNCESAPLAVTVLETPAVPAANDVTLCAAGSATLSVNNSSSDYTYTWYSDADLSHQVGTGSSVDVNVTADATYYVTAANGSCVSAAKSVTVTIRASIDAPNIATTIYACGGNATLPATYNNNTLTWMNSDGAPLSDLNVTLSSGSASYTATYVVNGCESQPANVTVTYEANPTISATGNARCGAGVVELTATTTGTAYWFDAESAANAFANASSTHTGTGATYSPSVTATKTYYVRALSEHGCLSTVANAVATVNNNNDQLTTTAVENCGPTTVTLTATGSSNPLTWYSDAQDETVLDATTQNVTTTTTYYVASTDGNNCRSALVPLTVTINTVPATPTLPQTEYCKKSYESLTLTASTTSGDAMITWITPENSIVNGSINNAVVGTYRVVAVNTTTNCHSDTVTVTVKQKPSTPAVNSQWYVCSPGLTIMYVNNPNSAYTYTWYSDAALTTIVDTGSTIRPIINESDTFYVTATFDGCESDPTSTKIGIKEQAAAPILPDLIYACDGSATLPSTYENKNLSWRTMGGGLVVNPVTVDNGSSRKYYAFLMVDGCPSKADTVTVTYEANPTISATGNARCGAGAVELTATTTGTAYWFDAESAANAFTNASSTHTGTGATYSPNVTATKTYYVRALSEHGCLSTVANAVATVNNNNDQLTTTAVENCGPTTVTLTATGSSNPLTWYSDAQGDTVLDATTQNVTTTTTYYVASTDGNNCPSALVPLTVTINTVPAAPQINAVEPICGSGSRTLSIASNPDNYTVRWYINNNVITQPTYNLNNLSATNTYYASFYDGTCESAKDTVVVVVNTIPAKPVITAENLCGAGNASLTATVQGDNTGCQLEWRRDGEATAFATGETASDNITATTTYTVNNNNASTGCSALSDPFTVTVFPTYAISETKEACNQYVWNNETFTQSGTYTRTLQTVNGCDSVVTLNLTVNYPDTTVIDTTVCDLLTLYGHDYTTSGRYVVQTSTEGCGSYADINVVVKRSSTATVNLSLCENELPYNFNGTQVTAAGPYTVVISNAAGCDSTITLNVTVNPQPTLSTLTGASRCGAGAVTLVADGTNGNAYAWYAESDAQTSVCQTATYNVTDLSETHTYYVQLTNTTTGCASGRMPVVATVNPVPANPVVADQVRCGNGSVTFTATIDDNATTCRWYLNNSANAQVQETGLQYTVNASAPVSTFYVESYNANTTCKSSRQPVTATVRAIPTLPQFAAQSHCGPGTFSIEAPATGTYQWYAAAEGGEPLNITNNTTPELTASTQYYISYVVEYNDITCASNGRAPLALTIYPVYEPQTIRDTICQGAAYNNHGVQETFAQAGDFTRSLSTVSSNGCDSVVTLAIHVKETKSYQFADEGCDSYVWNNQTYTTSGVYEQTITSSNGCDSVVTLTLTIHPSVTKTIEATACDTYTWNAETYTTSGDYVQHFQTVNGCDSAVTLHLTIHNSVAQTVETAACNSYTWNNETYTQSGTYVQQFQTVNGCDSVVTLNLTVNHSNDVQYSAEVCAETRYVGYGFDTLFTTAGTRTLVHQGQNVYGCDSTTTLTLTVNPVYRRTINQTICETATYNFNGRILNTAGTYYDTLSTVNGCDSMITLNLSVANEYETILHADICQGQTYTLNGFNENTTGVYTQTGMHAANGCDSTSVLYLTVHDLNTTERTASVCAGATYRDADFTIVTSTARVIDTNRVITTEYGCDSTIHLVLTVNPVYSISETQTVCQSTTPMDYHGTSVNISAAGTQTVTASFTTAAGCDSIFTLQLTVLPSYELDRTVTLCSNELPYAFGGQELDAAGNYSHNFHTAAGCDSIINLTLVVNQVKETNITADICLGETYNQNGFNITPTEEGTITRDLQKQCVNTGCDSTVHLTLNVHPVYHLFDTMTVCQSTTPMDYHGTSVNLSAAGTQTVTASFTTANGCDSIFTLTLRVNATYNNVHDATICQGERYVGYGFDTLPALPGQYTLASYKQTAMGCDSNTTVNLTVTPIFEKDTNIAICDDQIPYVWGDNVYYQSGDYVMHFVPQSIYCDSIINLHLQVNPTYSEDITLHVCQGLVPYTIGNTVFTMADNGQTKTVPMTTAAGCDSILNVTFYVSAFTQFTENVTICDNELPYQHRGNTYNAAGTYEITLNSADGCDTVITFNLNVNPTYTTYDTVTVCENKLPYHYGQTILAQAGTVTLNLTTVNGCDSTVVVTMIVNPNPTATAHIEVCDNAFPVQYGDSTIAQAGTYTVVFSRPEACDSIVTLTVESTPTYLMESTVTICSYESYSWRGRELTAAGVYYDSLQTSKGCDSVYRLTLNVNASQTIVDPAVNDLCAGESYNWRDGIVITASGTYADTVTKAQTGCYDIYQVTVNFKPVYAFADTLTICSDELPYTWNGHRFTASDTYTANFQASNGCDSTWSWTLLVNPTYHIDSVISVCSQEVPYYWRGQVLESDGIYYDSLKTVNGCDSITRLQFSVNPSLRYFDTVAVCNNELPYMWRDRELTTSGSYADSLVSASGCDVVYNLALTVNSAYTFRDTAVICSTEAPYSWRGNSYGATGTYYDSLTTVAGCDSVYVLALTVNPSNEYTDQPVTLCAGGSYQWRGRTLTETGLYTDTVNNNYGCIDIYRINVTVNPSYHFEERDTICNTSLPYTWRGITMNAAGERSLNLQTTMGCDSSYHFVLTVNPTYNVNTPVTICESEAPYRWRGQDYSTSGVYSDTLHTVAGCDSILTLTLTVNPEYSFTAAATICDNESYSWRGRTLTVAGTYYDSLQTAAGCDSVYALTLTVNPTFVDNTTATICSNESYSWRGRTLTQTGTYYDSLTTVAGCDSVYVLALTVNPSNEYTDQPVTLCAGGSYQWRGRTLTATGLYTDTVNNNYGCIDIYRINVTVNPSYHFEERDTICNTSLPYTWRGITMNAAGERSLNLQTATGCDSSYHFVLTVNPTYNVNTPVTICESEAPYSWRGQDYSTSGVYSDTLQTVAGCDSILTLTLTVNPSLSTYDTAVVCSNSLPYMWRGRALTATGQYVDTATNTYGCNDFYYLSLTVNPTMTVTLYDTICQGEHYQANGFDTLPAQYGTVYAQQLLSTVAGCDSIVNLVLTVNRTYEFVTYASTCDNEPYEWRGHTYDTAGVYYDTYQTQSGCDSVYVLDLILTPTYEIFVEDSALRNHEYVGYGLTITPADSGTFTYDIQNFTIDGCDSIIHLTLHVAFNYGIEQHVAEQREFTVYPNPATTVVNIKGEDMRRIQVYNGLGKLVQMVEAEDDKYVQIQLSGYAPGNYFLRILLSDGQVVSKKIIVRP
ncbi:MAG: T9SS type A sorting domain-containing protein [Bacteroidales bacterium]|nr:T9SS type A sorting domain-containing protein [Bacteroidales bacterium]